MHAVNFRACARLLSAVRFHPKLTEFNQHIALYVAPPYAAGLLNIYQSQEDEVPQLRNLDSSANIWNISYKD